MIPGRIRRFFKSEPDPAVQAAAYAATRLERIRKYVTKEQAGLEIGPSLRPCAPKKEGYRVEIIDHMDREALVAKYEAMGLDTSAIEEVDYIWKGTSYTELTGKRNYYDYCIASHVIEHAPDFIGFLSDISCMLKDGGVLSLAVPDKRYTLDHFRTVTGTGKMVDDHLLPDRLGSPGTLIDYGLHVVRRDSRTSWSRAEDRALPAGYEKVFEHAELRDIYDKTIAHPGYHDIHQYVFTPASFRLLIKELLAMRFIDMDIDTLYDTETEEFIVLMRKTSQPVLLSPEEHFALCRLVSRENVIA